MCFGKDQKTKSERGVVRKEEGVLVKGDGRKKRWRIGDQERDRKREGEREESVGNVTPFRFPGRQHPGD